MKDAHSNPGVREGPLQCAPFAVRDVRAGFPPLPAAPARPTAPTGARAIHEDRP